MTHVPIGNRISTQGCYVQKSPMRLLLFLIIEVAVLAITLVSFAAQRGSSINASQLTIVHASLVLAAENRSKWSLLLSQEIEYIQVKRSRVLL